MDRESTYRQITRALPLLGLLGFMVATNASAQVPVDEDGNPIAAIGGGAVVDGYQEGYETDNSTLLSAVELETLVGPVALYPDDLLAIVLPASTYPLEIVQAARFLEQFAQDSSLTPDENWDDSIVALLNYPEVVKLMNDDIDWTWKLGEAVVAQQNEVVAAVESFRDKAYAAGNLKSDEYQTVTADEGIIEIEPVSEDVIYVPYYEPSRVVVYSPRPVYHYYPHAYPLYYYPYANGYNFGSGYFWGVTTAFTIGWASDYLHVYHHSYRGHPYYGHSYYGHRYRRSSINVYNNYYVNNHRRRSHNYYRNGDYWRPRHRGGARPGNHVARNNYYSGGRSLPGSRNRDSGNRNYRDGRTDGLNYNRNDQRSRTTPGNSRVRGDNTSRIRDQIDNRRRSANSRSNPTVASDRPANRQGTRANGRAANRPQLEFRDRGNNRYSGSVAPRLENRQERTPRQSVNRSDNRQRNSDAVRFRARETSATPRSTRSDNARTRAPQRTAQNRQPRSTLNGSNRSSFASNTQRSNRQTQARVSAPPRQAPARSQPRRSSPAQPAARNSRPASQPSKKQSSGSSRSSSERGSSSRSSVSKGDRGSRSSSRGSRKR